MLKSIWKINEIGGTVHNPALMESFELPFIIYLDKISKEIIFYFIYGKQLLIQNKSEIGIALSL